MTDRPVIFSAPMVRALLDGRKTQTRRLLKLPPAPEHLGEWQASTIGGAGCSDHTGSPVPEAPCVWHSRTGATVMPRHRVGDRLYVREAFRVSFGANWYRDDLGRPPRPKEMDPAVTGVEYLCDDEHELGGRSYPSIHMPRWASRLTLLVTDVRIERLQAISDEDAWAEGVCRAVEDEDLRNGKPAWGDISNHYRKLIVDQAFGGPARAFNWLWDGLHGAESWAANPWVVAVSFRVERGNIDQIGRPA